MTEEDHDVVVRSSLSRPRTSIGLCSGYGGLELAVELACPGVRLVGAVERQAYAAAVLAHRMASGSLDLAPIHDDLESFDGRAFSGRVDLVVAGFPCQGASVAGKRLGIADERWLWHEVWRIVLESGARGLFIENVPGLLTVNGGRAFGAILDSLASRGWVAEWDCVPAGALGAPHVRDRLFLLAADPERVAVRLEPERDQRGGRREGAAECEPREPGDGSSPRSAADADGESRRARVDRGQAHGRDADGCGGTWSRDTRAIIDRIAEHGRAHWSWSRAPEPVIRGVDDGDSFGMGLDPEAYAEQLHLLGNGVVPHAAAFAFAILWERLHGAAIPPLDDDGADR